MSLRASIKGIASHLPEAQLTNTQLGEIFDEQPERILDKTGIAVRRIAGAEECASDLGVEAARKLFDIGMCSPDEIDFLVFCTQSPDYFLPTTACLMQDRLGLRTDCGAIDFNQGCSGFVYGLALAQSLIEAGTATNVLLVNADTYTKFINPRDRTLRTLFGDGAAATLIGATESPRQLIGPFVLGTDGRGANNLIVPEGGLRKSAGENIEVEDGKGNWKSQGNLYMDGNAVFNFTLTTVPRALDQLLQKAEISLEQIDYVIPHQANRFMLERLRPRLKVAPEKFCIDVELTGNTVSASIPIALESAIEKGRVKAGDKLALLGFGVGYSWAATLVELTESAGVSAQTA
jgi:3-oxoacyl-[acyl-carrier-protein] synthase-3